MNNGRFFAGIIALLWPFVALGDIHTTTLPLRDGRVSIGQLLGAIETQARLPGPSIDAISRVGPSVDLQGIGGWIMVRGLNSALGDAFNLNVTQDVLTIRFDPDKLPQDWDQTCDALDRFTQVAAPEATERQVRRFGLHLPSEVDPNRPMVILIHGLDGDAASCRDLERLLHNSGFQTAIFAYPAEQPAARNARMFTEQMNAMHQAFPKVRVDLVTESMGALLARDYVEGCDYAGNVDHLIMIAPPNGGSRWAPYSVVLKLGVNASDWWNDPQWSPVWMITEGIGESISDLRPESKFLSELNSRPRRAAVRYTIIAGDRSPGYRYEANMLAISGSLIPSAARGVWGLRQAEQAIQSQVRQLLSKTGDDDGPVSLASAKLAGVSDFVAVTADHVALYESVDGQLPAAWPTIQDRLAH
jgi:hypothetical protein